MKPYDPLVDPPSQSPENGFRLCKAAPSSRVIRTEPASQSPENGSRLCKLRAHLLTSAARSPAVAIP